MLLLVFINRDSASVTLGIVPQQLLDETGILHHALLIAVIAIDEHYKMACAERYLRALMITGRCPHPTLRIAIDRQPCNIEHASSDALIRLSLTPDAQCQRVAHELIGIKPSYAVAIGNGSQIDKVHEGVNLIELLTLQHATYELFGGRAIA